MAHRTRSKIITTFICAEGCNTTLSRSAMTSQWSSCRCFPIGHDGRRQNPLRPGVRVLAPTPLRFVDVANPTPRCLGYRGDPLADNDDPDNGTAETGRVRHMIVNVTIRQRIHTVLTVSTNGGKGAAFELHDIWQIDVIAPRRKKFYGFNSLTGAPL